MPDNENKPCRVIDKNFTKIVQLWQTMFPDYKEDKELFVKLLDGDFDINYKVPIGNTSFQTDGIEGCTIFHLAYDDIARCKALLNHGADFSVTNKNGSTVLLEEATGYQYKSYLDSIGTKNNESSYVNLILSAHISSGIAKNPTDNNGLSHFHIACMYNRADTVKFFLENGIPINNTVNNDSKFYPGFSALHFAANSCAFETVEILLTLGADMFVQDAKGRNPLHVLIVDRRKTLIKLQKVLTMPPAANRRKCSRLQEHCNIILKIVHLFLERINELGSNVDNTGLSCLHVICFLGDTSKIQQFLDQKNNALEQRVSLNSPLWPGYTALHFAAHSDVETVELLVKKGADLCAKDAAGVTPFEICLKEFSIVDAHRILLLQPDYFNIAFSESKTKLGDFIYAMQDSTTFKTFLESNLCRQDLNEIIPLDSPVCAGFTALHLATVCAEQPINWDPKSYDPEYLLLANMKSEKSQNYLSRIKSCLKYKPDVTSRDARGSTPLHWAFKLQQSQAIKLLLQQHKSIFNPVDEHGISHLHIACAANNRVVVKRLLESGANVNEATTSCCSWMNTIIGLLGTQAVRKYFVKKGSTPLHFASKALCLEIIQDLIDRGADVLAQDVDGFNPLERLCETEIFRDSSCQKGLRKPSFFDGTEIETIELLVKSIGDKLADTKPKQMLHCYDLLYNGLLFNLSSEGGASVTKILDSVGITALHVACFIRNLERVTELVDAIDVNARVDSDSPLWAGCTPLHIFTASYGLTDPLDDTPANQEILQKLLQNGADVAAVNAKGDTPIHQSFLMNFDIFRVMAEYIKDFSVNPMGKAGYTHLHIASAYGASSIVEKLLGHGAEVDYTADYFVEDYSGFTALHFAALFQQKDVVDVLLKYRADVNRKNGYGQNPLHVANGEDRPAPCLELLQTLISAGADINLKDMYGETPLEALMKTDNCTKDEIELFVSAPTTFHAFNLMTDEGFLAVALNRRQELSVYEMVVNSSSVKEIDGNGRNVIHNIVSFKRPDWVDLENDMIDGDLVEDEIDERYTPSEEYILEIRSLVKLGLNIDKQDNKGFTPLHLAARMQNLTGIIGLLENGADINITDSYGKPAFAYSFKLAKANEEFELHTRRKELKELDRRILKIILTHVYKLNLTGILVGELTREAAAQIREIQSYDTSRIEKCMNQIEEMKEQLFETTSITFYDFLSDTGAVSNFPYFLLRQQIVIRNTFENEIETIREIFPELAGIILWQYRKTLARCEIIESATTSLKLLVNFSIPPNILKMILRFLTNGELNSLITSTTTD